MTDTPLCDFLDRYERSHPVRLHMPGHKGVPSLGCEPRDITEIDGADALYEANDILLQSERRASEHFGAHTFYSTEGSSLCIRAMLALIKKRSPQQKRILAARNAHKAFLSAAALLDLDPVFLPTDGYLSVTVTAEEVDAHLGQSDYAAVYLTVPDYLGHSYDLAPIAAVCRAHGVPLLVDNAHGAYLKFLSPSRHPIDLGADLCCDSAHKTLPALTGAAYLHVAKDDRYGFAAGAKEALALFGSTSPSYLILQSLDALNGSLRSLPEQLASFLPKAAVLKAALTDAGFALLGEEPLKVTIDANAYGYTGDALAALLQSQGIYSEYHDPQVLVWMLSPCNTEDDLFRAKEALLQIPKRDPITPLQLPFASAERACSVREAMLAPSERLPLSDCLGRVLAQPCVGCPPAVPIRMCGERIDAAAVSQFRFYGIETLSVVKNAD